ncbi:MAG: KH domain-containing protein [Actinomycetota bacterium]|nr:KH domain-containing protein [Actinomycetota bacterium]
MTDAAEPGNELELEDDEVDDGNVLDDELDDGDDLDDEEVDRGGDGNRVHGGTARATLEYIARSLADTPDAVVIDGEERGRSVRYRVHVAPGDMGRLIGRRGRVAQAIRTLVRVGGARDGVETNVDFVDD